MYIYQITNLINGKIYIGQTNNITKRWSNHKCNNDPNTVIARAIRKYGIENFKFEVLYRNVPIEDIDELEIKTIQEKHSRVPEGYNVAKGGQGKCEKDIHRYGAENANAHLTDEEVRYILLHRNIPMYILYSQFSEKISYNQFKKVYHHQVYKNIIVEEIEEYPNNFEFSNQFTSNNVLEYDEVIDIRERYAKGEYWRDVFQDYKHLYKNEWSFYRVYYGYSYSLVMPEVFTQENKKLHSSKCKSCENNGRAKLTEKDVKDIRAKYKKGFTRQEIYKLYPQVSPASIRMVINNKTWTKML